MYFKIKNIFFFSVLFSTFILKAQNNVIDNENYSKNLKCNYWILDNFKKKNELGFSKFYLFIYDENIKEKVRFARQVLKENELSRSLFCFIEIPDNIEDKQKFFLDFSSEILSKRKLSDSKFIVVSNEDYTEKYEIQRMKNIEMQKELGRNIDNSNPHHFVFLNQIFKKILKSDFNTIKKEILNKE